MVISFILMYIIIPLIVSLGGFFAPMKDKKKREVYFICFKGVFYLYLALSCAFQYFTGDDVTRAVTGFTISLAILESATNFKACIPQKKI